MHAQPHSVYCHLHAALFLAAFENMPGPILSGVHCREGVKSPQGEEEGKERENETGWEKVGGRG